MFGTNLVRIRLVDLTLELKICNKGILYFKGILHTSQSTVPIPTTSDWLPVILRYPTPASISNPIRYSLPQVNPSTRGKIRDTR